MPYAIVVLLAIYPFLATERVVILIQFKCGPDIRGKRISKYGFKIMVKEIYFSESVLFLPRNHVPDWNAHIPSIC
jgi:hypothetical protein